MEPVDFRKYPNHGIIGAGTPTWLNAMHTSIGTTFPVVGSIDNQQPSQSFRKRRFDFYLTYEKHLDKTCSPNGNNSPPTPPTPLPGLWSLWQRLNNIRPDFYQSTNQEASSDLLPSRFRELQQHREGFYGCAKDDHPFFQTSSSAYGKFPPTIHDVPRKYHALKTGFSSHLSSTGMPKNRSLNIK